MKSLSLLSVFVILAVADLSSAKIDIPPAFKEMLDALEHTCIDESKVDHAVLDAAKKLDIQPDANFKCFLKCMMTNMGVLSEDGVFEEGVVIQHLPDALKDMGAVDVVHKCKGEKGSDPCDTAFKLVTCFASHAAQFAEVFT